MNELFLFQLKVDPHLDLLQPSTVYAHTLHAPHFPGPRVYPSFSPILWELTPCCPVLCISCPPTTLCVSGQVLLIDFCRAWASGIGEASKGGKPWEDSDSGQGSPESPHISLCAAVFQMYSQEKLVLEELNRYTGARLQPLSRGLY